MESIKLQDKILSVIVENTQFPPFEIGQAYKKLKSFDKLLACIDRAAREKRPLESVIDVMVKV